jgi:hypothetical protein
VWGTPERLGTVIPGHPMRQSSDRMSKMSGPRCLDHSEPERVALSQRVEFRVLRTITAHVATRNTTAKAPRISQ